MLEMGAHSPLKNLPSHEREGPLQLSGYSSLTSLYIILVLLAMTERAMSRVEIIKNRLHSTMLGQLVLGVDGVICRERLA